MGKSTDDPGWLSVAVALVFIKVCLPVQVVIQLFRSGAVDQEWSRTGGRLLQHLPKPLADQVGGRAG